MAAAPSSQSRWLFGPLPDLLLGCGLLYLLTILVFAAAGPSIRAHQPVYLVPLLILLVSMPHYGGTLVRVYEHRADRRSYVLFSVWATLLVFAAFVVGVYNVFVASLLFTLYITWSPWHYTGQNYGIAVMFLRRRGVALAPTTKRWLYASFILSYAITFVFFHGALGEIAYSPDVTADQALVFLPLGIPAAVTGVLLPTVVAAYLVVLAVAAVQLLRVAAPRDLAPTALLVLSQALWFSVPFAMRFWNLRVGLEPLDSQHLIRDYIFFVALAHAAQYLWVTAYYARASRDWHGFGSYFGKTLAAGVAVWTIPVILFAPDVLGTAEYNAGLAVLVAAAVNIHHFILDGVIWKLRHHRIANVLIRSVVNEEDPETGGAWLRHGVWGAAGVALLVAFAVFWASSIGYADAMRRGDSQAAASLLDGMAWIGRDNSARRVEVGRALARGGDAEGALRQFARAAELSPGPRPHEYSGRVHALTRDWDAAAASYEAALAFERGNPALSVAAGEVLREGGRGERARELLAESLALHPDAPELHDGLGRLASAEGNSAGAVEHFRAALKLRPDRQESGNDLAWILATSGDVSVRDPDEAIRLSQHVIGLLEEPDPNVLDTLAASYAAAGRFDDAAATAERAAELARAAGKRRMERQIEERLVLYRSGRPYVEAAPPADG